MEAAEILSWFDFLPWVLLGIVAIAALFAVYRVAVLLHDSAPPAVVDGLRDGIADSITALIEELQRKAVTTPSTIDDEILRAIRDLADTLRANEGNPPPAEPQG